MTSRFARHRIRVSFILILSLWLGGCADHTAGNQGKASGFTRFGAQQSLEDTGNASEPRIVASGDLVVVAPGGPSSQGSTTARGPYVWVSRDRGTSFERISLPTRLATYEATGVDDMDVIIDAGTIYVATMLANGIEVVASSDRGVTWRSPALVTSLPGIDRPWLVAGPNPGAVSVAYAQTGVGEWLATSSDSGLIFQNRAIVSIADIGCACSAGHPSVDASTGTLWVPFISAPKSAGTALELALAISTDSQWSSFAFKPVPETRGAVDVQGIASLASSQDSIALAWEGPMKSTHTVWFLATQDGGKSWSRPVSVASESDAASLPWIETIGAGNFAIAAYVVHERISDPKLAQGDWFPQVFRATPSSTAYEVSQGTLVSTHPAHTGKLAGQLKDFPSLATTSQGQMMVAFAADSAGTGPHVFVAREEP